MEHAVVDGDLLDQPVAALVNPWNRGLIPHWLLVPHGVSGALKRAAGLEPFRELRRGGSLPLGAARATSAGRLAPRYSHLIHVAGIDGWWRASAASVTDSTRNAVALADQLGLPSLALPLIGSGSGGLAPDVVYELITSTLRTLDCPVQVTVVRYRPGAA